MFNQMKLCTELLLMLQQVMLYNIDKNCIYVLFKWEYFYTDGKRLPYTYSLWFLNVYPVLQENKIYCNSIISPTENAQTHSSLQGQRCIFLLCIETEEPFPFDLIYSDKSQNGLDEMIMQELSCMFLFSIHKDTLSEQK